MALGMSFQILALQAVEEEEEEEGEEGWPGDRFYSTLTDEKLKQEEELYDNETRTIVGMLRKPEVDLARTNAKAVMKMGYPYISIYYDRFLFFGDSIEGTGT
jgi:hypothetical protein